MTEYSQRILAQDIHDLKRIQSEMFNLLKQLVLTRPQQAKLQSVLFEQDIKTFINTCRLGSEFSIMVSHLFNSYKQWCKDSDHQEAPKHIFGNTILNQPGINSFRTSKARYYRGISL